MIHEDLNEYLACSPYIDFDDPLIMETAGRLCIPGDETATAKSVYEYVRDRISHSFDIGAQNVTVSASQVLKEGHGICYAKANLLAAMMRYLGIPCGFGYQRILLDDNDKNWLILHGYNFVFLKEYGKWIKLDARGNHEGVNALFSVNEEKLAFPVRGEKGESDENINHPKPKTKVIESLLISKNLGELALNLPQVF